MTIIECGRGRGGGGGETVHPPRWAGLPSTLIHSWFSVCGGM
jgi:hypothetical protein